MAAEMSVGRGELFPSYSVVEARREWEIGLIKEKLERSEAVDLPLCRVERVSAADSLLRFGLKRGKLLYVFRYTTHDVERDKHRNVITRARFIKHALEQAGYRLIPWDFKKGKPPTFWEEEEEEEGEEEEEEEGAAAVATMEEDDDDLYGPSETTAPAQPSKDEVKESDSDSDDEPMDVLESGEDDDNDEDDDDDDDSDSDLEIIIDKPQTAPKPVVQPPQESKAIKIEAPPQPAAAPSQAVKTVPSTLPQQPGTTYPAVRTSTIDVNADPVYQPAGKPVTQIDIDSDLVEDSKAWRKPGADQSDWFNYGFDEFTWELYRQRQQNMTSTIAAQKADMSQFQQMFGGMGGPPNAQPAAAANPPVPGAPTGPAAQAGGGMGGMPPMPSVGMSEDQMTMMFQQMASQGIDPGQMDFGTFMQMAGQGMGGFGGAGGQQGAGFGPGAGGQQGGQGGGGRGGGGRRGRGGW